MVDIYETSFFLIKPHITVVVIQKFFINVTFSYQFDDFMLIRWYIMQYEIYQLVVHISQAMKITVSFTIIRWVLFQVV